MTSVHTGILSNARAAVGTSVASVAIMEIRRLLRRCQTIESEAAKIYRRLSSNFVDDAELSRLFAEMAADERGHAEKLATWRRFLHHRDPSRDPLAVGFEQSVMELEALAARLCHQARKARTAEEALHIALELENSEIDTIYTTLLQSSPLARFPDVEETCKAEIGAHHEKLLRVARARCRSEDNLLAAAILGVED